MEGLEVELQFLLEGKAIDEGPIDITGNGKKYIGDWFFFHITFKTCLVWFFWGGGVHLA